MIKNLPANAGDTRDLGLIPGLGRSPGGGNGKPLQYSCLENPMDREAWLGYSPRGRKESDTTEQLHFQHFPLGLTGFYLPVQGTLKSLIQHHSSKASVLQHSTFFMVQFSHPYTTTEKTITLTIWTFVSKVMSLLFNMLSKLVITFPPRSKRLLISWL